MKSKDLIAALLKGTPCRTTIGHGESCVKGYLCDGCHWRQQAADHIRQLADDMMLEHLRAERAEASERPLLQLRDELLAENEALRALLREALQTIRGLVEQQAMDDPWWTDCANRIDTALGDKP